MNLEREYTQPSLADIPNSSFSTEDIPPTHDPEQSNAELSEGEYFYIPSKEQRELFPSITEEELSREAAENIQTCHDTIGPLIARLDFSNIKPKNGIISIFSKDTHGIVSHPLYNQERDTEPTKFNGQNFVSAARMILENNPGNQKSIDTFKVAYENSLEELKKNHATNYYSQLRSNTTLPASAPSSQPQSK